MSFSLKPATLERIDQLVPRYPQKRSAVLPLLHFVQEEQGYISNEAIEWIAARLELEPINVYELVTFYPGFRQKPIGRTHIRLCRTLSCALNGGYRTCATLEEKLGCKVGHTSEDGEFTLEWVECLASCGTGPVALVGEDLHENLTPAKAEAFAAQLKANATAPNPA